MNLCELIIDDRGAIETSPMIFTESELSQIVASTSDRWDKLLLLDYRHLGDLTLPKIRGIGRDYYTADGGDIDRLRNSGRTIIMYNRDKSIWLVDLDNPNNKEMIVWLRDKKLNIIGV